MWGQTMHDVYGYAQVGRFGLAHSLLAWARCTLWCTRNNVPMLAPSWFHFRPGPYLRGEMDKRHYNRFFQFSEYITGIRRWLILGTVQRIHAENPGSLPPQGTRYIYQFNNGNSFADNEKRHFSSLIGNQELLRSALERMTRPQYRPVPNLEPHIALHVRMGDFSPGQGIEALKQGKTNSRLPVEWYVDMLRGLRERLNSPLPARLFSDGTDEELRLLLDLPDLKRIRGQAAITDMLSIGQGKVLISAGSGFSYWGSFLGNVPRICFPGQRLLRVLGTSSHVDLEPECETARDIPQEFLEVVRRDRSGPRGALVN